MPPAYRRMILILVIFLGAMLLVGRIDFGLSETPATPPHVQAMLAHQKAEEAAARERTASAMAQPREYERNPYLDRQNAGRDCQGEAATTLLRQLRDLHRQIDRDIDYAEQGNPDSLEVMRESEEALAYLRPPACLERTRQQLQAAARSARSDMRQLGSDASLTSHELQTRLRDSIRWAMDFAQREMDNVQEALQQP